MIRLMTAIAIAVAPGLAFAKTYKYSCKLMTDYHVAMDIEVGARTLRLLDQVDTSGRNKVGAHVFNNRGLKGGKSQMKDRLQFVFDLKKSAGYPEIHEYFLSPELTEGGTKLRNGSMGGFLSFAGHGYSWETYICFRR